MNRDRLGGIRVVPMCAELWTMNKRPDRYTEAERVEFAETMARLNSRDVDYPVAVITGTRGDEQGVHVIFDEVRPGEMLHSIWQQGKCLLRKAKA